MKRILTARTVASAAPPQRGQTEIYDRGYPGLALRISYGGGKSFTTFYHTGGKHRRMTLGIWPAMSLAEARDAWRQVREAVARGEDPARAKQGRKPSSSFDVVVEEWLKRDQSRNRDSTQRQVQLIVANELMPAWTGRAVGDIGKRDVLDLLDGICDRGAPIMANRVFVYTNRFFRWCVSRDVVPSNPMAGLSRPGVEKARDRVLTDGELAKVWRAACDAGGFGRIIRLLILTGARKEEVGRLRWDEVVDDHIKLTADRTKTGEPNDIPLSSAARALLAAMAPLVAEGLVFATGAGKPITSWARHKARLDAAAGVTGWRIHDLRRTFSTGVNELGAEPHVVESILGHKIRGVAGVYNKAKHVAAKRAAVEAWGAHVLALVEGRDPGVVIPMRTVK